LVQYFLQCFERRNCCKYCIEVIMKIGLSYSRCIRDIVDGAVDPEDVLVVISRTDFDPTVDTEWDNIWRGYTGGRGMSAREWSEYGEDRREDFRNATLDLWHAGKLHQPRKFGAHPGRRGQYWLEAVLPPSELERNPAARDAWDRFQVIAGLSNIQLDREYH
jgi:hypothetical protein